MFNLINIALGIFLVGFLPNLLPLNIGLALATFVIVLFSIAYFFDAYFEDNYIKLLSGGLLIFCIGIGWGHLNALSQLKSTLPITLDKHHFMVTGIVQGLVNRQPNRLTFNFDINSIESNSDKKPPLLKKLRLSWYGNIGSLPQLNAGEHWQLLVRLRTPRGLVNFTGFDYQSWLIENNYSATGYVLVSKHNHSIFLNNCKYFCSLNSILSQWREAIQLFIFSTELSTRNKGIISALSIGDKSAMGPWWNDLSRFGIVHLLVISGLHIGLVAGFGFLLGSFFSRLIQVTACLNKGFFIRFLPPLCGFFLAFFYSLLAGFSLPTQRAMIVVFLLMLSKIFYLRFLPYAAFIWALFLIALTQPLAVIGASFWLSFSAVGILLFYFLPRISVAPSKFQLLRSQWILFIGMTAPLLLFIGKFSWLGLLINLIAVPIVSFITVPLCLIASMIFFFSPVVANLLWQWAGLSIDAMWFVFDLFPKSWGFYYFSLPATGVFFLSMALVALAFLLPKGLLTRWLLIVPFALHLVSHKPRLPLRMTFLDVGQGLSVVIESRSNVLVYDTGTAYSESFDMGSAVVAPFVMHRGFKRIDKVVISHGDKDHSGGLDGLSRSMPVQETLLTPGYFAQTFNRHPFLGLKKFCDSSKSWRWPYKNLSDQTEWIFFDILWPTNSRDNRIIEDSNNNSCVLLIRWRDKAILLPGDIERRGERLLLENYQLPSVDLLVAPHHGSKTSSSQDFIEQLVPDHVVFSAGYRHHFGHPHKDVVSRYRVSGAELWSTAETGAVTFEWNHSGVLRILTAKDSKAHFWWR